MVVGAVAGEWGARQQHALQVEQILLWNKTLPMDMLCSTYTTILIFHTSPPGIVLFSFEQKD